MNAPRVSFSRKQAATDLWEFGEDQYVDKTLRLTNRELRELGERVYANFSEDFYKSVGKMLPASGYDIGFVTASTLVEHFEGKMRSLKLSRRRRKIDLPKELNPSALDLLSYVKGTQLNARIKGLFTKIGP